MVPPADPYFRREHLPQDRSDLARILVAALGSGHSLNIDGIGGGAAVTTKVAMLSPGSDDWTDVDYFFAQVFRRRSTRGLQTDVWQHLVGRGAGRD